VKQANARRRPVFGAAFGALLAVFAVAVFAVAGLAAGPARAQVLASAADVQHLSIEQLADVEITSVSRHAQPLSSAAAAAYVVTHDDIMRAGATSLPQMLRLAPNLQVAQINGDSFAVTARGFNGNAADKLLVLVDGRSVYTSLYGGVMWDEKGVLPDNVERIEVISGPAGALWGANAVNGVINIITRAAADTQGGTASLGWGNRESRASLQYGGRLDDDLAYRVYGEIFNMPHSRTSAGTNAQDRWTRGQGGFRLDWTPQNDRLTLSGDVYDGREGATPTVDTAIYGGNLQASWQHPLADGGQLQLLGYFDTSRRDTGPTGGYVFDTYDLEGQHSFSPFAGHEVVWGAGGRIYHDSIEFVGPVTFAPAARTQVLGNVFAQDTIALSDTVRLIAGAKLEADPYLGLNLLPNLRLSWQADPDLLLWASYSHSVRAPTRFDTDLRDALVPGVVQLNGNRGFLSEMVRSFEAGSRWQADDRLSISLSAYYNRYSHLRSVETVQAVVLPIIWTWGNLMEANTYGLEGWVNYQLTDWWRLGAGLNLQHQNRKFKPGSSALGGVATAGDDPDHQAWLRSSVNLGDAVTLDADLRWIGALPDPKVPGYAELTARIGWQINDALELSLRGDNLLHTRHIEYMLAGATIGTEVYRSVFIETRVRF
jgi:iron complex outermembrane receptor protein